MTRLWGRKEEFQILGVLVESEAFNIAFLIININLVHQNANFETTIRHTIHMLNSAKLAKLLPHTIVVKAL